MHMLMSVHRYFRVAFGVLWFLIISMPMANAAFAQSSEQTNTERQVMAAYIYKFGGYIDWPSKAFPASDTPLKIGVIGSSDLADALAQVVVGRVVNGRQVIIQKVKPSDSLLDFNVLFIGASSNEQLAEILGHVKGQPVLTVTEAKDGLALGSIINFVIVDGKLRFEISSKTASSSNISISARLLVAAYRVVSG
jgi:hypothetical protein